MRLVSAAPSQGFMEFGIPGKMNALSVAMYMSTPNIICMLLDQGFDPMLSDVAGNHPFLFACISNRVENVKYWLNRFSDWDLESPNILFGGTALSIAVYMGANRLELVKVLIKAGANVHAVTDNGASILGSVCSSEDGDPNVADFLIHRGADVNYRVKDRTFKWKAIRFATRVLVRLNLAKSGLVHFLATESGTTALNHAVLRGNIEVVELLLSMGADPRVKNDLGQDAAAMCKSFPELRGVLEKRERKMKLRGTAKKTKAVEVLGKRISTATPIQHAMWLISLETLLMLYVCSFIFLSRSLIYHTPTLTSTQVRRR